MNQAGETGPGLEALARQFAAGEISRRTALRRFAVAAAVATIPSGLLAPPALADCPPARRCRHRCCPKGARCRNGRCKCRAGKSKCGRRCVDLLSDPANCATCGNACAPGEVCVEGDCRPQDPGPQGCTQDSDCVRPICQTATCVEGDCRNEPVPGGEDPFNDCGVVLCTGAGACEPQPVCGNGVIETGEVCDGTQLGGGTCQDLGYQSGTLVCLPDCSGFDESGCQLCGNGKRESPEQCDGNDFGGATCETLLGAGAIGTLTCTPNCIINSTNCQRCGNGVREGTEQCDGAQLGGQTCVSRGFSGGMLTCAPNCTYDTTGCTY